MRCSMKTILLLDDEKHIRRDLGKRLRRKHYAVHTASSIVEATKIIKSEKLDYVIIDLYLDFSSNCGGFQAFIFAIRHQPWTKAIILSAYPFEHVKHDLKDQLKGEIHLAKVLEEVGRDYIQKGGGENYILAVLEKLTELDKTEEKKMCFVIMPFSSTQSCDEEEWTEIFEKLVKPAVEDSGFNYECKRANLLHGEIIEHIMDNLNRAQLVIADLTDKNPNVLYELGVRHALRDVAILISQDKKDIPFDLQPYIVLKYGWKLKDERDSFKKSIREAIFSIELNPSLATSPVGKYLNPQPC